MAKICVSLMLFCLIFFTAQCIAQSVVDISGRYRCTGDDFLNHRTFDEPTVVKKTGNTYLFKWTNDNLIFYGTGLLNGNTISALFWASSLKEAPPGIVSYQILPNGDLKGLWTLKNRQVTGSEYCQKLH